MHKGRTFMGTVHFTPEVAAQTPALPLNLQQAKPAGAAAAPHKVAEQNAHAQPQRQPTRQQRQAPLAHSSLAQAAREAVTPPPSVVAARGKQVPASLAQEDKVSPCRRPQCRQACRPWPLLICTSWTSAEHTRPGAGEGFDLHLPARGHGRSWPPYNSQVMPPYQIFMQDLAAQRLEALGPTTVSYTNESGSEARRAQAEREFLRMEREGPPAGTK